MAVPLVRLNTGVSIPAIGFGSAPEDWSAEAKAAVQNWVVTRAAGCVLQLGYRLFNTAQIYGTEHSVGAGIRASGVPREEVFVTTKLPWHHGKYVARSFEESLKNLGQDYVDLYLMHYPQTIEYTTPGADPYSTPSAYQSVVGDIKVVDTPTLNDTWAEMEKLHASGRARAIGVSNFSVKTLEQLLQTAKIVPAVNEVECHPWLAQPELVEYCRKKGIVLVAYTPTGREPVRSDPTIVALAQKYSVSPAQISLAWHVSRGTVALPSAGDVALQKENITLPTLSSEDLAIVTALDRNERIVSKIPADGVLYGWTAEQYGWD
ncbi:NADP-dependent oxidoreductase domain-containing protein [Mycena rebaudengoi]|nr:NADP-dependent oxidoreductase domain-containing protein [Mycena rebaudengoi]